MIAMKTMVITGASTGLGKVMALKFAKDGYKVCAVARSREKLEDLASQAPGQIFAVFLKRSLATLQDSLIRI